MVNFGNRIIWFMEKKFSSKLTKLSSLGLAAICILLIVSCEDDAILQPQSSDDCQGSYCNLSLSNGKDYAFNTSENPMVY